MKRAGLNPARKRVLIDQSASIDTASWSDACPFGNRHACGRFCRASFLVRLSLVVIVSTSTTTIRLQARWPIIYFTTVFITPMDWSVRKRGLFFKIHVYPFLFETQDVGAVEFDVRLVISPTKLEYLNARKSCDIIDSVSLVSGADNCYKSDNLTWPKSVWYPNRIITNFDNRRITCCGKKFQDLEP